MTMYANKIRTSATIFILILICVFTLSAKDKDENSPLRNYTIEGAGRPAQGSYLVKVTVNTKNRDLPDMEIAKCAVHGVIFKGFSSENSRHTEKPLARSASVEAQHNEYFELFFSSQASSYANSVSSTRQVMKSGKKYVITEVVEVLKDNLKKELVDAGVIHSLDSGY